MKVRYEFLSYAMAVKTVGSLPEALEHTHLQFQTQRCIITENKESAILFTKVVDAACCVHQRIRPFTDGAQFGLGAEIGISTRNCARGPMGLEEITSYKWIVEGNGQIKV